MPSFKHIARTSLIGGDQHFELADDGLVVGANANVISYGDIRSLRLITFAGAGGRQGRVTMHTNDGSKLQIGSHHYVSLGNFEDRSESYVSFVRELSKRISTANPQAHFITGSYGLWLAWLFVVLLVLSVCVLIVAAVLEARPPWMQLLGATAMLVIAGPFSLRWAVRSRPQSFDPKSIPSNFIV